MSDFKEELRRIDALTDSGLARLVEAEKYEEALERLDDIPPEIVPTENSQRLRTRLETAQQQAFKRISRSIRTHISLDEIDEAQALLVRARSIGALPELTILASLINSAALQQRTAREVRDTLERARRLSRDDVFLSDLRDARAVYQSLLDRAEVIGRHLDLARAEEELRRVERRIRSEEAQQSVIGTKSTLDDLRPNLDALRELEARLERGQVEVALKGAEMTPIVVVVQELEAKVRPRLERLVGQHYEDARRQFDERGDPRAALKTLNRQRPNWRYLADEHIAQLEDFEHELTRIVEEDDRKARIARDAHALLLEHKPNEAARLLELEVGRLEHAPQELVNMLDQARNEWLGPLTRKVSRLTRRVKGLGSLQGERVHDLTAMAEGLVSELSAHANSGERIAELSRTVEEQLDTLDRLEEVAVLKSQGRLHDAQRQLGVLAEEHPELRPLAERLMSDVGSHQSTEELLAEARSLYGSDPKAAIEFARKHVGRDRRFANFMDFAVLEGARRAADKAEAAGQYDEAVRVLSTARGALVERQEPTVLAELERLRRVIRDASAVEQLIESIERGEGEREVRLIRLARLEIGRDRRPMVQRWLGEFLPEHLQTLETGVARWKKGEPIDLEGLRPSAEFIERQVHVQDGDVQGAVLLEEYRVCVSLAEASIALTQGALDEAEAIAQQHVGSRFAERVTGFLRQCKARRALVRVSRALGNADFDTARGALVDAPREPEVEWAEIFVERLAPLVSTILEGGRHDPVEAFGEVRRLVEEQPDSADLRRLLERLGRRRLEVTLERLAEKESDVALGVQWARLAILDADYRAAGETVAELAPLTARITPAADAELEKIFEWMKAPEDPTADVDIAFLERLDAALAIAERLHPARTEIEEARRQLTARIDAGRSLESDRAEVQRLMNLASEEGARKHLLDAKRIEDRHAGAPFGVAARLAGWRQCDTLVGQLETELTERRLREARSTLTRLTTLSRSLGLPHADTVTVPWPELGTLGPGVDAMQLQLDGLLERDAIEFRELEERLREIERDVVKQEKRRTRALELAQEDDGEDRALDLSRNIGEAAQRHLDTMSSIRSKAASLGLEEHVSALSRRLSELSREALTLKVLTERREIQDTLQWLNEQRVVGIERLRLVADDIRTARKRFPSSKRVTKFARALENRLAAGR